MSTAAVLAAVGVGAIAGLDVLLSGLRSSLGRSGLIDHRAEDRQGLARGAVVGTAALSPAAIIVGLTADTWSVEELGRVSWAVLTVLVPYAVLVLAALGVYLLLSWRLRYFASAVILGPMTLLRPAVALAAAVSGTVTATSAGLIAALWAGTLAILVVEPFCGRLGRSAVRSMERVRREGGRVAS